MSNGKFKSGKGFVLASVGAAVGLGNALRFPGMCAKYGGGAYLLIYAVALVVLGVPLLNTEIALGRKLRGGAPECMESLRKGGKFAGWASCVNSVFTALLYAGLAGWIIANAASIVPLSLTSVNLTQSEISGYFFEKVMNASFDGVIYDFSFAIGGGIIAAWVFIFFCLKGGAEALAKAAKFTVIIPVVLLVAMAVRGMFYGNAGKALAALFVPDFSKLSSPELWLSALGQVFFSLSVVVGIMPAYGAYLPEKTGIFSCSMAIAAADFFVSVLASVVMFTTLYGCGLQSEIGSSGIITAFAVYPAAICRLFGGNAVLNAVAGVLFYLSLAMMAVQSGVSMLEAFASPFIDKFGLSRKKFARVICLVGAVICLIYATSASPLLVEITDRFVNFYNVLLLGILECILIGLSGQCGKLAEEINRYSKRLFKMPTKLFSVSLRFLCPAVIISLTLFELVSLITHGLGYPPWAGIAFGWGVSLIVFSSGFIIELIARYGKFGIRLKTN